MGVGSGEKCLYDVCNCVYLNSRSVGGSEKHVGPMNLGRSGERWGEVGRDEEKRGEERMKQEGVDAD